jgi:hypothetical protein
MDTELQIKELNELMDNAELSFRRFEGWGGFHYTSCRYFNINLLPSLCFTVDSQMNESWILENGNIFESYIGIGFHFDWLGFNTGFEVNFKTNKPLSID